jgi:alpha-glucosidase (family GH31 glycosyl hydrolase)
LPWGWNTGELGLNEITSYGDAANPDPSELHNAAAEPVCKKYLELRYRLMPYLYSTVRECCQTGMPVLRALWLHHPGDAEAVKRGDEFLWGRNILVAPVVEKGAVSRSLYLPRGAWLDFWTNERVEGGREITRSVDLATVALYVRAGAIVPVAPVRQFIEVKVDSPAGIDVYAGADGEFLLYEDDGWSFNYRRGEWMGIEIAWADSRRALTLRLAAGSRMLPPARRDFDVRVLPDGARRRVSFEGRPVEIRL